MGPLHNMMQHRHDTVLNNPVDNSNYTEITEKISTNGGNINAKDFLLCACQSAQSTWGH